MKPLPPETYVASIHWRSDEFGLTCIADNTDGSFLSILSVVNLDCEVVVLKEGRQDLVVIKVTGFLQEVKTSLLSPHNERWF